MLDRGTDSPQGADPPPADCCATESRIARHFDHRIADLTTDTDFPEMVDVSGMLLDLDTRRGGRTAPSVPRSASGQAANGIDFSRVSLIVAPLGAE